VIYVASGAHAWCAGVDLRAIEHPREGEREYNGMQAYARAKSANILTAKELTRRAGGRVLGFSLTPGGAWFCLARWRGLIWIYICTCVQR
jgi:hypothetical protein